MKKKILVIDGLATTGKSYLAKRLIQDQDINHRTFIKFPLTETRDKMINHSDPILNQFLFKDLLMDILKVDDEMEKIINPFPLIVERFFMSTLVTMRLSDVIKKNKFSNVINYVIGDKSHSKIKVSHTPEGILNYYLNFLLSFKPEEILIINMEFDCPVKDAKMILRDRAESFYFQTSRYLDLMVEIEKDLLLKVPSLLNLFSKDVNIKLISAGRKESYRLAREFLGGK